MKTFGIFLILTLLLSCNSANNKKSNISITELNYGLYKAKALYNTNNEKSASGKTQVAKNSGFYKTTTNVTLKFEARFGAEFIVNSSNNDIIELDIIWKYPNKIKNDQGEIFSEYKNTRSQTPNEKTWTGYVINRNYEMVTGIWTLEIYHKGKKLYQKEFLIK